MRMPRLLFIISIALYALLACPGLDVYAATAQSPAAVAAKGGGAAQPTTASGSSADIMAIQTFNKRRYDEVGILKVEAQRKHKILFIMGVCLLLGIFTTAGLGLAMVLGDKPLFMWHMAIAGITVTLAIAHAVTSIIWFFPF